jgi:hypothetical protein
MNEVTIEAKHAVDGRWLEITFDPPVALESGQVLHVRVP